MTTKTHLYIQQFEAAYKAHTNPPAPTLTALLIAKYPDKMRATAKSSLTGIGRLFKGPSIPTKVW